MCRIYQFTPPDIPGSQKDPPTPQKFRKNQKGGEDLTQEEILQELCYPQLLWSRMLKKQELLETVNLTYIKAQRHDVTGIHSHYRTSQTEAQVLKVETIQEEIADLFSELSAVERTIKRRINLIPNDYYAEKRFLEFNFLYRSKAENADIARNAGRKLVDIRREALRLYGEAAAQDEREQDSPQD